MKKKYLSAALVAVVSGLGFLGMSLTEKEKFQVYHGSDLKNTGGSPVAKTGAPGEGNCTSCHSGAVQDGNAVTQLVLTDQNNNVVTQYTPGYTYTVSLNSSPATKRGFQLSMRILSNNTQAGTVTASTNTAVSTQGTKKFVNHKSSSVGSAGGWSFTWVAPSTDVGDIRFYAAVNLTNNNNNDSGDQILMSQHTISPAPAVTPTASFSSSNPQICASNSVSFTNTSIGGATSYSWDFPGGTPSTSSNPNETVVYSTPGTYTATLTATNSAGSSTSAIDIIVNDCASVVEKTKDKFHVFVDQTNATLLIKNLDPTTEVEFQVCDLNGKMIARQQVNASEEAMNVSQLQTGSYVVKIISKNGVFTKKIVKS